MNKRVALIMLGSTVLVAAILGIWLWTNQEALLTLEGKITNIRLVELNDGATMALLDFEGKNPSKVAFETAGTSLFAVVEQGKVAPAAMLNKLQAEPYLEYAKMKEHKPVFGPPDVVLPGQILNHLIAGRFYTPPDSLKNMGFRVEITSVNGTKITWFAKLVDGVFTEVTAEEAEKMVPIEVVRKVDKDGNVIREEDDPAKGGEAGGADTSIKDVQEVK